MEKYRITNITVKPPRRDKDGNDLRAAVERVGHPVQFRDENDRPVALQAGYHCIVSRIDGGLLGLQRGGFIKIEPIEDIATALKEHAFQSTAAKTAAKETAKTNRKASAKQMGLDDYTQKSGAEYEGAVNPDGDPNFLVTAKRGGNRRTRKTKGVTDASTGSGDDATVQQG